MNVTIREGYTNNMVLDTERHFVVAARALRDRTEVHPDFHKREDYGLPPDHDCARVNIYGDVNGVNINKCNEFTSALDLVTNARELMVVTAGNDNGNSSISPEDAAQRDFEALGASTTTPPEPPPGQADAYVAGDPGRSDNPFRKNAERAGRISVRLPDPAPQPATPDDSEYDLITLGGKDRIAYDGYKKNLPTLEEHANVAIRIRRIGFENVESQAGSLSKAHRFYNQVEDKWPFMSIWEARDGKKSPLDNQQLQGDLDTLGLDLGEIKKADCWVTANYSTWNEKPSFWVTGIYDVSDADGEDQEMPF